MSRTRRLPGIAFQVEGPVPETALPRMDIAAFVGLASSGPLDTPVPVEDPVRFRELFGPDLILARDALTGQLSRAQLGPAVDAFFRNGGKRCYVVRVAGWTRDALSNEPVSLASCHHFPLPALVQVPAWNASQSVSANVSSWAPAVAVARSPGAWSAVLRAGTVLHTASLILRSLSASAGAVQLELGGSLSGLSTGELLRLSWISEQRQLFGVISSLELGPSGARVTLLPEQLWWFQRGGAAPADPSSATWVSANGPVDLEVLAPLAQQGAAGYLLTVTAPAQAPAPGDMVRVDFPGGEVLCMPITAVEASSDLPGGLELLCNEGFWPLAPQVLPASVPYVERLSLELLAWQERALAARLDGLGFHPSHASAWFTLPTDQALWELPPGGAPRVEGPLDQRASSPRFPFSGQVIDSSLSDSSWPVWLPLGMDAAPRIEGARSPLEPVDAASRLTREGLDVFSADLFLDPELAELREENLLTEAQHRFYVRQLPLRGLHSLIPFEEVSLLALPDASHRHWLEVDAPLPALVSATVLSPIERTAQGELVLKWQTVQGATLYILERAEDPSFDRPARAYEGSANQLMLSPPERCPSMLYFRVRAEKQALHSPWSNTERIKAPTPTFDPCDERWIDAPEWLETLGEPGEQDFSLHWLAVQDADRYCLELSSDPLFQGVLEAFSLSDTLLLHRALPPGLFYVRVQAWRTEQDALTLPEPCLSCALERVRALQVGPWSTTLVLWIAPAAEQQLEPTTAYDAGDLLAVQRAAMRLASARGDLVTILGLPAHHRGEEARAHLELLFPDGAGTLPPTGSGELRVRAFSLDEARALSYAALYHPWLAVVAQDSSSAGPSSLGFSSPEGSVVGMIAATTLRRGAWIAPANLPLEDVVALRPALSRETWQQLNAVGLNLIRQEPRGFMAMSAETLSLEPELQLLNVRRLLILLRRLALREGNALVFAPHDARLRERVRSLFEQVLTRLYLRGALVGATPDLAFRVIADAELNPPSSVDAGRLIVELRVAPSRPLSFITVRLIQRGNSGFTLREA